MDFKMKRSKYRFDLPHSLVASYPSEERDQCRLMILHRKEEKIEQGIFRDILDYMDDGDALITNNTRVLPARLYGRKDKTRAKIGVLLLRHLGKYQDNAKQRHLWDVSVDPARKIRVGNKLYFGDDSLMAEVMDNTTSRGRTIKFHFEGTTQEFYKVIERLGMPPLPDMLAREPNEEDKERFQTVYAKHWGSVSAASAGFHFTKHLLKRLEIKGVQISSLTLHMGQCNYFEVDVEDLSKYKVNSEEYYISPETANLVNRTKDASKRVFSVGVGTARGLESSVVVDRLRSKRGMANIFIYPPYQFRVCDALVTNFHLPMSPMLILTSAFAEYDFLMHAYKLAIKERYRFFNYGDAMLIL